METENSWERIQNTENIIDRAKTTLDEMMEKQSDIQAIGLTGQMHGITYVDKEGHSVSPLYTWQDGRGNLPDFNGKTLVQVIEQIAGIPSYTGYGLVTHLYNCRKGLVPERAETFCTIADYFGMVLTGRREPLVHASNAASFGFFDVEKCLFKENELELIGKQICEEQAKHMLQGFFPEITDSLEILGTYQGIPVSVAIGDNQSSFLGAVGDQERAILVNMGTGGQISLLSEKYIEVPGVETRPFLNGNYLLVGASLCGGRAYALLEQFFRRYLNAVYPETEAASQYMIMEKLAEKGRNAKNGMKVTTTFSGTRLNPEQKGKITDIMEENFTPESLIYGVLHGMVKELYDFYRNIDAAVHIPAEVLVASGNGLRKNRILQELFAEMFGAPITVSEYEEEAACGAAKSALKI